MRRHTLFFFVLALALASAPYCRAQNTPQSILPDRFADWISTAPPDKVKPAEQDAALLTEAGLEVPRPALPVSPCLEERWRSSPQSDRAICFEGCFARGNTEHSQVQALRQRKKECGVASLPLIGHQQATCGCAIVQPSRWSGCARSPFFPKGSRSRCSCSASSWRYPDKVPLLLFAAARAALRAFRRQDC